ncbi:MAG: hypothetical protein ABR903_06300 [Thermodesulfovibrionales bacterium]
MSDNGNRSLVEINKTLKGYLQQGYNIPGVTTITERPDFMQPGVRIVQIETAMEKGSDNDIYHISGGRYGFGKPAIVKFINAGRVDIKILDLKIEKGNGIARYTAKVSGERFELDGSPKRVEDVKSYDLIVREEAIRLTYDENAAKEHLGWTEEQRTTYVDKCVKKVMIEKRKFAAECAVTGAQARVVQKLLGLKSAYPLDVLKKPFVIIAMTPVVDMKDRDIKMMVTANMLGIRDVLYPHATAERPLYLPHEELTLPDDILEDLRIDEGSVTAAPIPDMKEAVQCSGDFEDYPRGVKENILKGLVSDADTSAKLSVMEDEELVDLYHRLKVA